MSESTSNIVYLFIAGVTFAIAVWKSLALLRDPTPTLALTAAMFVTCVPIYVLAAPVGYRALGDALDQPSFATLPVYVGILACFAYLHVITLLWDQQLRERPTALRRSVTAWSLAYSASMVLMVAFFLSADLSGPADPLRFNTRFADDPLVLTFLAVFLVTLTSGTLNTFRRSRRLNPEDPQVQHSLRVFMVAMLFVFGYAVCQVPAITVAALGNHSLDALGLYGAVPGVSGCLIMCYGLSGSAVEAWLRERRDIRALQPLWDLVVGGVDEDLAFSARSARSSRLRLNVTFNLHRRVIEILDGIRALRPWVAPDSAETVYAVHARQQSESSNQSQSLPEPELEAAATATALCDAVERLQAARRAWAVQGRTGRPQSPDAVGSLPGENTPAGDERDRLLRVARALSQPLVRAALQELRDDRAAVAVPQQR
ncbi:MAB_1171c family putative transporter [Streptomyces sp. NPDC002668]|uniref:MAB_1171c family putative transporter n=1 Tax=Streptomyces sp. NPDC002668 TaxID=3154422 RepID=UPI003327D90D